MRIDSPVQDGEVEVGERVTVLDLLTSATADYWIVAPPDADPTAGRLGHDSPLGAALLGRHVGDVVEVELAGTRLRLEVVEIDG